MSLSALKAGDLVAVLRSGDRTASEREEERSRVEKKRRKETFFAIFLVFFVVGEVEKGRGEEFIWMKRREKV